MRPSIRDAVVYVGAFFFLVNCAAAAPAPALGKGEKIAPIRGYRSSTELGYVLDFVKDDLYKTEKFDQYVRERQKGK